ncbi:MAG: hypothetical protein K0S37_1648 [Microbacterium sp.]|jgi:hypothetical protein|nr:hypothetical protein [Microbacterium sp.]
MKLRELLQTESLGLAAVSVPAKTLEREVTGGYITDLPDPSRFLSVGDIVLTSGMWFDGDASIDTFVDAVVRQRVVALVVGLVHLGHVPDALLEAARRADLALLTISGGVSFKDVAEHIRGSQSTLDDGLAEKALQINRRLAEMAARGEGAQAVLEEFRSEFAVGCWLLDDIGTLVAVAGSMPPRTEIGRVWNAVLGGDPAYGGVLVGGARSGRTPAAAAEHTVWSIATTGGDSLGSFVCDGDLRRLSRDAPLILDSVIAALRLDLELSARWREHSASQISELVKALADDTVAPGEISARMRLEGLDPQDPTIVAVAEVADSRFPIGAVREMSTRLLAREGTRVVGAAVDTRAVLLINGPGAVDMRDEVDPAAAQDCLPLLGSRQLRVGISDARTGVGNLAAGFASARDRLAQLQSSEPVALAASSQIRTHRAILAQLSERARSTYARDVLRPLHEYDARHGADLVATLRVFLTNAGAWQESARQLHLHTNTLRYRVSRIEELTGRSIASMDDRVDLFLALQIEGG